MFILIMSYFQPSKIKLVFSTAEEVVVEFPQLTKKSLKSTSVDWYFGDCGQGDESSADETYQISSCQLFQGKLGRIELTALCLLGPSGQDLRRVSF